MATPCALCADQGTSCCKGYQIFLTPGDVHRISDFSHHSNFFIFESPIPEEIEPDYDPSWLSRIISSTHLVRVLKRTGEKQCCWASENGCLLPPNRRPLICRLYPYTFNENCFLGIDSNCPISKNRAWQSVLNEMNMPLFMAKQWLDLLYLEIREDIKDCDIV